MKTGEGCKKIFFRSKAARQPVAQRLRRCTREAALLEQCGLFGRRKEVISLPPVIELILDLIRCKSE
jgi:hypothetical protein